MILMAVITHSESQNISSNASAQPPQQPQPQPLQPQQPVTLQDSSIAPASPVDITIILFVSLLFIAFFILWIRAYSAELARRKNQQQIRRWQERERLRQRLQSFMIMREEEYWKSLENEECLPMYEEFSQLQGFDGYTDGAEEFEMREFDRNPHIYRGFGTANHHMHMHDVAIESTRQDGDQIECTRQDEDHTESSRQDGDQIERIIIREPPPVYMSLGRI